MMVVNEYISEEVECEIKSTDDLQKELHFVLFCFVFIFNNHCLGLGLRQTDVPFHPGVLEPPDLIWSKLVTPHLRAHALCITH